MPQLTIIPADKSVIINGEKRTVDCSLLPSCNGVHAVQWDGTTGQTEFEPVGDVYMPNETLTSVTKYQEVINAWNAAPPAFNLPMGPPPP